MAKDNLSDRVMEFILQRKDEELAKLTVKDIARYFKISESFLGRKFKADVDISVGKYIFRERMFRAANLLVKNENLTIKSLAETAGFYDYDYFIRAFRQHFGVTPARYRDCKTWDIDEEVNDE